MNPPPLPADVLNPVTDASNPNEDPITHEHGAHPFSTGVGAAGGGAAGAAIGVAVGGPVGGIIGAVIGAVAGGLGGKTVGESIDPTLENESWPGQNAALSAENAAPANPPPTTLSGALHEHGVELDRGAVAQAPTHEEIALRAWGYYMEAGMTDGHDVDDWLRAEAALRRERLA